MGPIQDYSKEHLVATDRPIVMVRRILARTAYEMEQGIRPPALDASTQRVRAASVLLDRKQNAQDWAKETLTSLEKPVFTV
jgi:hypothetical protein